MIGSMRKQLGGRTRPAFTMLELLVAATVTALTAAAGASFISAISNASLTTRDVRAVKTDGHYALMQIGQAIRQARCIGQVTSNSVTLWSKDSNSNDQINLYETAIIRYDSALQQILYDYTQKPPATVDTTTVTRSTLINSASVAALMPSADKKSAAWVSNVSSCTFTGSPSLTDTRMVEVAFSINSNGQTVPFRIAVGPRAPADYLFYNNTTTTPPTGSVRKGRKYYSRWTGFGDVTNLLAPLDSL